MELLDQPKRTEESDVSDPELDASYRTLDRVLGSVQLADNKALIALTFQGGVVAGVALISNSVKSALAGAIGPKEISIIVACVLFFICLGWGTLKLFQTISPRIAPPHSSEHVSELFYFGGIATMKREVFAARTRDLDERQIHEAIVTITHVNANIALQKFTNLRHAFQALGLQVILFVVIVMLAVLPGHAG